MKRFWWTRPVQVQKGVSSMMHTETQRRCVVCNKPITSPKRRECCSSKCKETLKSRRRIDRYKAAGKCTKCGHDRDIPGCQQCSRCHQVVRDVYERKQAAQATDRAPGVSGDSSEGGVGDTDSPDE